MGYCTLGQVSSYFSNYGDQFTDYLNCTSQSFGFVVDNDSFTPTYNNPEVSMS